MSFILSAHSALKRTALLTFVAFFGLAWTSQASAEVTVKEVDKKLRVEVDGELLTEFIYQESPKPYLYPVMGPGGQAMTRNYPMKKGVAGEQADHPHHKSIWHGHQDVNGYNLWSRYHKMADIVHDELLKVEGGKDHGTIVSTNNWIGQDKKVLGTDQTTMRFYGNADARIIDYEVLIKASHGKIILGDEKDAFVGMRVHPALRITDPKHERTTGSSVNSEGLKNSDLWGKRAKWVDYWGPIDGKTVGIAMFDHPTNLRHPAAWHARDYGLVSANPFGLHYFSGEKLPRQAGQYEIEDGETLLLRYRFYIHKGDAEQAEIAKHYEEYIRDIK